MPPPSLGRPARLAQAALPIALVAAGALAMSAAWAQALPAPSSTAPPQRERLQEFFDSLSDIAITLDRLQVYQRNGQRREVDLFGEAVLSLDESRPSLLSNPRGTPFGAGRAGRVLGLSTQRFGGWADARYEKRDGMRRLRLDGAYPLDPTWSLIAGSNDLRSELAEVPGQPITGLRRRDVGAGLRWQGIGLSGARLSSELTLRHSTLSPSPITPLAPSGSADFLFWRGQADSARWPGLSLNATLAQPVRAPAELPTGLRTGRAEFGAEWRLGPGHPWAFLPEGSRIAWREAPRLGLLSDDEALTRTAAYHRNIGLEVPDGSPGGSAYAQWRQHSLASGDDTQAVLGWRHGWRLASGWGLESRLEQAVPLSGPSALRAIQVGGRAWVSDFPRRSTSVDVNAVTSSLADSAFASWQITQRLADDWLSNLQLSSSRAQPHGNPAGAISGHGAALALGWREPTDRALHLLGRVAWSSRQLEPAYADPTLGERRAWTWLGHASVLLDSEQTVALRSARRIEHNDRVFLPNPRTTSIWLTRWTRELPSRWSVSTHLAERRDSQDGHALSLGAEIGRRLSQRLTLALGYNLRGFADNELTLDERPQRGITLRLRFTIEGVLGRWLDAGRSDGPPQARAWPSTGWAFDEVATIAPSPRALETLSPLGVY